MKKSNTLKHYLEDSRPEQVLFFYECGSLVLVSEE